MSQLEEKLFVGQLRRNQSGWRSLEQTGLRCLMPLLALSARIGKLAARWLRFLLLLGGDIERNPGPERKPRGVFDLRVGFESHTAATMDRCLAAFTAWVQEHVGLQWDKLVHDAQALATALRAYGIHCFGVGLPRYMFVYSITAVQDQFPLVKSFSNIAWQVDKKWQQFEPGICRPVLPSIVIRALICLSTLWGWHSLTGIVILVLVAMLHPSEMLGAHPAGFSFPSWFGVYMTIHPFTSTWEIQRPVGSLDDNMDESTTR